MIPLSDILMPCAGSPFRLMRKPAALRWRAFEEKRSIASIVRECLEKADQTAKPRSVSDFSFVGSGASQQGRLNPVSRNHDRASADAVAARARRK